MCLHRDVPVSFDTLVENVVDPSHVQFSHHGVIVSQG
jgi:phenylpropionate dioxygenase-like ring-hydroxylating dioxygenase large terminal subunit